MSTTVQADTAAVDALLPAPSAPLGKAKATRNVWKQEEVVALVRAFDKGGVAEARKASKRSSADVEAKLESLGLLSLLPGEKESNTKHVRAIVENSPTPRLALKHLIEAARKAME